MSSYISLSSGPDTKVRINGIDPPKELTFSGAGVSVVSNDVTGKYEITITGASVGAATTSAQGIVQLATSAQTTAGLVVQASDTRLSDARTPTAHASTHKSGGSDSIKLDELAATTDVSTLNTSTLAHGLAPKLSNNANQYLDGSGSWSIPPGTAPSGEANTASNAGLAGTGIVLPKSGVNLPFKAIDAGSTKISISDDVTNKTVDIDVVEANLTLANLSGSLGKTKLPAEVVYTDQANTFGAFDQTLPSTRLKLSNSGFNAAISVGTLGGNVTITLPSTTDTVVGRATTDTLTNKTLTTPTIASILNTGTLTLPSSTDTLVGRATTDTLTNKTLTTPVISSISNTGTITLPTATDTLVGKATTDTLTNKSISGSTNTLSNIAKGSIPAATVYTDQTNTFGAFAQIFPSSQLKVQNPGATFAYILAGSAIAADRTITLPLLAGNDTVGFEANTATLTNKTINATNNTITDSSTALGDLLKSDGSKFTKLARGSANQVLSVNSGGTDIAWSAAPTPSSYTQLVQDPTVKKTGYLVPIGAGATVALTTKQDGILSGNSVKSSTAPSNTYDTSEGLLVNYQTIASLGDAVGMCAQSAGIGVVRRAFVAKFRARAKWDVATNIRQYFGFTSLQSDPITDTPLGTTNHGILVGFNSTDTNYQIYSNDGAGGAALKTQVTGPVAVTTATSFHTIEISWTAAGNATVTFDGTAQTISTQLPGTTTTLYCIAMGSNVTSVNRILSFTGVWLESDK